MPWHITTHTELPIIEVTYSDSVNMNDLLTSVDTISQLINQHDTTLVLADCTHLKGGHSITELYFLADVLMHKEIAHSLKEAIILPHLPESVENVKFWQNACLNRFIVVQLFNERTQAIAWLLHE